jgi:hypothetical protein
MKPSKLKTFNDIMNEFRKESVCLSWLHLNNSSVWFKADGTPIPLEDLKDLGINYTDKDGKIRYFDENTKKYASGRPMGGLGSHPLYQLRVPIPLYTDEWLKEWKKT